MRKNDRFRADPNRLEENLSTLRKNAAFPLSLKTRVPDQHEPNHCPLSTVHCQLKKLLLALLLLVTASNAFAQQYPLVKYTVREGLVQNQVLSMLKDSRGYVWCGTWYGLSRFNGETFENFTEAEGLWNVGVKDIVEDNDGRIWVANGSTSLACFDGEKFKRYKVPTNSPGNILFNRNTNSIRIWESETGKQWEVKGDTLLPVQLPNFPTDLIHGMRYHSPSDTYYLVADQQIVSYRNGQVKKITDNQGWNVTAIIHDEVHLAKTISAGIVEHYVLRQGKPVSFLRTETDGFVISNALDYPYVFINQETLYYLPAHSTEAERVGESPPGMPPVGFLNQTESSMLWIPTEKGLWGLMLTGFKNFKDGEVPNPWSVVEDSEGKFLFLNYWKGVQEYDGKNLRFIPQKEYYPKLVEAYKPLKYAPGPDSWYFRALRDQSGYCWLPDGTGLYRYRKGHFDFIRKGTNNLAFSIAEDVARRKIVVASHQHAYTVSIDPPFRTDSIWGEARLFSGLVFCVAVAPNGQYWIAGRGVERYDPDTKVFTPYNFENSKLPQKVVVILYFDWEGTLWAGGNKGLYRFDAKKDRFEKAFEFGFYHGINAVEQIDSTHLLITDSRNLYVLNLKKFNASGEVDIKTFNHHNGFMGMEPGQLGSYRDSQGRIWITSGSVLSVLDPTKLDLTTRPLRTMIASVNKRGVSFIHPEEVVEVPEGESIVNIKVETLGEDKPYNSQFSYKLEGEMDDWTDWQEQPLITLNNLSNGLHTLKVRSRSGDFNAHAASIATLHFRTKVAIWKSPDFYLYAIIGALALLAALALLGAVNQRRRRKVLQQQAELLEQRSVLESKERGRQLLQAQTIQSQLNTHFTANTLSVIQNQINRHEAERATKNLIDFARLARAYLEDSLLQAGGSVLKAKDITLEREVSNLKMYIDLMQLQYENRHIEVDFRVAEALDPTRIELPPFLIQPYVENAFVHGLHDRLEGGVLRVEFRDDDGALLCHIEDNGLGHEAAPKPPRRAFSTHKSVSTGLSEQRADLLNELGYDIRITTTNRLPDTGTIVTVRVGQKTIS